MRRLFVPGYYSGFSNNKMSLDIAIVLAYLTGRVLVPYRFRLPRRFPVDLPPDRVLEPMLVPDLFDIPVPYSDEYLFKTWISVPGALQCAWAPVFESVFCFPATLPTDDARFQHFRNGRRYVYTFSEQQDEAPDLHINTQALGHYSYFFYLDEERRRAGRRPDEALATEAAISSGRGPHCCELRTVQCHPHPPRGLRLRTSCRERRSRAPPPSAARKSWRILPRVCTATIRSSYVPMALPARRSSARSRNTSVKRSFWIATCARTRAFAK